MFSIILFAYLGVLSNAQSDSVPCKLSDKSCIDKISLYSKFIEADPGLKTESMDPMNIEHLVVSLSTLHAEFTDTTVKGYRDCKMDNVTLNDLKLHFDLRCPLLKMKGKYVINGKLIILPVNGSGDYRIDAKTYHMSVDIFLKLVEGSDGKTYLTIKDFKQTAEPLEPIEFDFSNLFNGNKQLADIVLKFANENWLEVAQEVNPPVLNANFKKIFKNANKYLKTVPVEK